MVHGDDGRAVVTGQPSAERLGVDPPGVRARQRRVAQQQPHAGDLNLAGIAEQLPDERRVVVIAGDGDDGVAQRGEQFLDELVVLAGTVVDQVAADEHARRAQRERQDPGDHFAQRICGRLAVWAGHHVQVGDLDDHRRAQTKAVTKPTLTASTSTAVSTRS